MWQRRLSGRESVKERSRQTGRREGYYKVKAEYLMSWTTTHSFSHIVTCALPLFSCIMGQGRRELRYIKQMPLWGRGMLGAPGLPRQEVYLCHLCIFVECGGQQHRQVFGGRQLNRLLAAHGNSACTYIISFCLALLYCSADRC